MSAPKTQSSQLAEGLTVHVTQFKQPTPTVKFEIDNQTFSPLSFTLDITGSNNLSFVSGGLEHVTHIPSMKRVEVGTVHPITAGVAWSLSPKFRWVEAEADESLLGKAVAPANAAIAKEIAAGKKERLDADSLSHTELLQKCRTINTPFIDVEFPPTDKALSARSTPAKNKLVHWRRAKEFLPGEVKLFEGGIEPNDIKQGELGDCW